MAITSLDIPFLTPGDLIAQAGLGKASTAIEDLAAVKPNLAFPADQMVELSTTISDRLKNLGDSVPSELSGLAATLATTSPQELSSIMFAAGYDFKSFTAASFDLSLESLVKFQNNIGAFNSLLEGGCEVLNIALKTSQDINSLSLKDLDVTSAVSGFLGGVASDLESIVAAGLKSATDTVNDIKAEAEAAIGEVYDALDSLENVSIADIEKAATDAISAQIDVFNKNIAALKSSVGNLGGSISITEMCAKENQKSVLAKMDNLTKTLDDLPNTVKDVSAINLNKIQAQLEKKIDLAKERVGDAANKQKEAKTAAAISQYKKNNPEASPEQIENATKRVVAEANKSNDAKTNSEVACVSNKVTAVKPQLEDLSRASAANAVESAQAGRPVVDKAELISRSDTWMDGKVYDAAFFKGSKFASANANKINLLHPIVRTRVAEGIAGFIKECASRGYDIHVISSFRSKQHQANLNAGKGGGRAAQVSAPPGRSWHNYGCGIDVNVYDLRKGVYIKAANEKYYVGLVREVLSKYKLSNPVRGDVNHFIPSELVGKSLKGLAEKLTTPRGTPDEDAISSLFT